MWYDVCSLRLTLQTLPFLTVFCCSLETERKTFYSAADKPTLSSRSHWASWSSLSRHRLIPASWRAVRRLWPSPWRLQTKQLVVVTDAAPEQLEAWKRALSAKYIQTWNYNHWKLVVKCKLLGTNGKLEIALYKQLTCLLQKYRGQHFSSNCCDSPVSHNSLWFAWTLHEASRPTASSRPVWPQEV